MSLTLHQATEAYLQFKEIAEQGEIDPQTLTDTLDSITDTIQDKTVAIGKLLLSWDYDNQILDAEIKRLQELKRIRTNNSARLKQYAIEQMVKIKLDKIQTPTMTVTVCDNPQALVIADPTVLPKEYVTTEIVYKPKNAEIKQALKDGKKVNGAHLERGKSLRIK